MNSLTELPTGDFLYIECDCGTVAVFNSYCATAMLEQQRQAEIERVKRVHVCEIRRAA